MRLLAWLVRAFIFFTLFAFAMNNQHDAAVRWFFGQEWRAPMVFIVLAAFALGCGFGVFAMVPSWWRHRRVARQQGTAAPALLDAPVAPLGLHGGHRDDPGHPGHDSRSSVDNSLPHPPRDGL